MVLILHLIGLLVILWVAAWIIYRMTGDEGDEA